jgi:hypothetical protein
VTSYIVWTDSACSARILMTTLFVIIAPPEDKLQFSCIGAAGLHNPNPKHDALKSAHESNQ